MAGESSLNPLGRLRQHASRSFDVSVSQSGSCIHRHPSQAPGSPLTLHSAKMNASELGWAHSRPEEDELDALNTADQSEMDSGTSTSVSSPSSSSTKTVIFLTSLYCLQGVPMGLSAAVPFLLQSWGVPYSSIAGFSMVSLPFSLKILWAPVVDSYHFPGVGRRKTWLIPTQLICGLMMIAGHLFGSINKWTGESSGSRSVSVSALTIYFMIMFFLMATQDVAVDGWALEMLPVHERRLASTCNTVGQQIGAFVANVGFLALNDPKFCTFFFAPRGHVYTTGLVSLSSFVAFWGYVMVILTIIAALGPSEKSLNATKCSCPETESKPVVELEMRKNLGSKEWAKPTTIGLAEGVRSLKDSTEFPESTKNLDPVLQHGAEVQKLSYSGLVMSPISENCKNEVPSKDESELELGLVQSYWYMARIVKLKPVLLACSILLIYKAPFGPEAATNLKLVEYGMTKEEITFMAPFIIPWAIMSTLLTNQLIKRYGAIRTMIVGYYGKCLMGLIWCGALGITSSFYRIYSLDEGDSTSIKYVLKGCFYVFIYLCSSIQNTVSDFVFVAQMAFFAQVSDTKIGGTYMTVFNTVGNLGSKWPAAASLYFLDRVGFLGMDGYIIEALLGLVFGLFWMWSIGLASLRRMQSYPLSSWLVTERGINENEESQTDKEVVSLFNESTYRQKGSELVSVLGRVQKSPK